MKLFGEVDFSVPVEAQEEFFNAIEEKLTNGWQFSNIEVKKEFYSKISFFRQKQSSIIRVEEKYIMIWLNAVFMTTLSILKLCLIFSGI